MMRRLRLAVLQSLIGTAVLIGGSAAGAQPAMPAPASTQAVTSGVQSSATGGAGSQPASVDETVTAIGECMNAASPGGVLDYRLLRDKGWLPAGRSDRKDPAGKVEAARLFFGRGNTVLSTEHAKNFAGCRVIVRLAAPGDADTIRQQTATRFGLQSFNQYKGDETFKSFIARKNLPNVDQLYLLSDTDRMAFDVKNGLLTVSIYPHEGQRPSGPVPAADPKPASGAIAAADACLNYVGPRSIDVAGLASAGYKPAPTTAKQDGAELKMFRKDAAVEFIVVMIPEATKRAHCHVFAMGGPGVLAKTEFQLAAHLGATIVPEPDGQLVYLVPSANYYLVVKRRAVDAGEMLDLHFLRFDPADKP